MDIHSMSRLITKLHVHVHGGRLHAPMYYTCITDGLTRKQQLLTDSTGKPTQTLDVDCGVCQNERLDRHSYYTPCVLSPDMLQRHSTHQPLPELQVCESVSAPHQAREEEVGDYGEGDLEGTLNCTGLVTNHVKPTEHQHSPAYVQDDQHIGTECCREERQVTHQVTHTMCINHLCTRIYYSF